MFYNERGSQIAKDAEVLKRLLDVEWGKYAASSPTQADGILQQPRSFSPPPGSAQKKYPEIEEEREREEKEEREREQREREREQSEKEEREREIQRKKVAAAIPSVAPVVGGAPGTRGKCSASNSNICSRAWPCRNPRSSPNYGAALVNTRRGGLGFGFRIYFFR